MGAGVGGAVWTVGWCWGGMLEVDIDRCGGKGTSWMGSATDSEAGIESAISMSAGVSVGCSADVVPFVRAAVSAAIWSAGLGDGSDIVTSSLGDDQFRSIDA
jgi:hypothetical protein